LQTKNIAVVQKYFQYFAAILQSKRESPVCLLTLEDIEEVIDVVSSLGDEDTNGNRNYSTILLQNQIQES